MIPIVVFAFNRPDALARLVSSLKENEGWNESDIYVFIDGPRHERDAVKVKQVSEIASSLTSNVRVAESNKGLARSVIDGVTEIIERYGSAIVLEDDLVLMPGFLAFMKTGLDRFRDDKSVLSICGYGLKVKRPSDAVGDVYLADRSSSWGWATWADRWNEIDWTVGDYAEFAADKSRRHAFNRGGSDMADMLQGYMEGRNNSWAIRFCYHQFKKGLKSVHPFRSLVANEGYGLDATNCRQKYSRFQIDLDDSGRQLDIASQLIPDERILRQLRAYHSMPRRIYSRIRRILNV